MTRIEQLAHRKVIADWFATRAIGTPLEAHETRQAARATRELNNHVIAWQVQPWCVRQALEAARERFNIKETQ